MFELLYTSVAPQSLSEDQLMDILINARIKNKELGITGLMIYHDREIIIFDESTSALDSEIEEKIFNDLKKLKGKFTAIFISHNKNLLKFCNKVYELKNKGIALVKNEK